MKLSLTKKIVIAHIIVLIAANFIAKFILNFFPNIANCYESFPPMLIPPFIILLEFCIIPLGVFLWIIFKNLRTTIENYAPGFVLGIALNTLLMIPACLIIEPKGAAIIGVSKPVHCSGASFL